MRLATIATSSGIQIEGNLFAPDIVTDLLAGNLPGQAPEDFGFTKTDKLADEIATAWGDAKAYWAAFQRARARLDDGDAGTTVTREQWAVPLLRSLGYSPIYIPKAELIDGQTYAVSHRVEPGDNKAPVHVVGCGIKLEQRPPSGTPRLSAHALIQEYLNRTEHLWAVVTNGVRWRLLRNSSLMTRLTYIEFDLEQILDGENFAEFGLFYRLFHRSRLPKAMDDGDACLLEQYHQQAIAQGGRVRDRLRDGVESAVVQLGRGFLQHPDNKALREKVETKQLTDRDYHRQVLQLIYRLLFLMVAESRNLLLADVALEDAQVYLEYYSVERLRALAEKPSWRREGFQDLWQGLKVTFRLFDESSKGQVLGLSPLNGDLFGSYTLVDLNDCVLDNHDLLTAIRCLSLYNHKGQMRRVNYAALDVEEFGSVYESLLDFHPQIVRRQGLYEFHLVVGSDRKTTGSHYTPPELVNLVIKSALEPVMQAKLEGLTTLEEKVEALKNLKVCDPACGSGHFLLAAARRIGLEIARIRTGELQPGPNPWRLATREAIQNCIYGVDLNPFAVDLCKLSLWVEGFCKGYPLNFLNHRIRCGNALVGVIDLNCLNLGIPDEAFKAVTGDTTNIATKLKKTNKKQRENQDQITVFEKDVEELAEKQRSLDSISEDTPNDIEKKKQRENELRRDVFRRFTLDACDLWTAAFFTPITEENLQLIPTTELLNRYLRGGKDILAAPYSLELVVKAARKLSREKSFFHWVLEFPEVFAFGRDGFDCLLGNPPWERVKLQKKEFFASRSVEIAYAANKVEREKLLKELPAKNPELAEAFEIAKRDIEAQSNFIRVSDRYPLTAVKEINTYAVFSEVIQQLTSIGGRIGIIVPTGIATGENTSKFFRSIVQSAVIESITGFKNSKMIFPGIKDYMTFCVLSFSNEKNQFNKITCSWLALTFQGASDPSRKIDLTKGDLNLFNPNTYNAPIFRTPADFSLSKKIYKKIPILDNKNTGANPWNMSFMRMFDSANERSEGDQVPLYEAKMFHQFDHRYSTYEGATQANINEGNLPQLTSEIKQNKHSSVQPRYWIDRVDLENRLDGKWQKQWLLTYRKTCRAGDERSSIFTVLPRVATNDKAIAVLIDQSATLVSCFLANVNSLIFDFSTRQKLDGPDLSYFIVRQLPVISPEAYSAVDIEFVSSRVLELVYTAWDLKPFAEDMGYDGEPFTWNSERRALLRAELDAYYAHLYGLTRDELRYILDPADVYGSDFPSETFRVLKNNEIKQFGEYRTQRLVLEAWDRMFG